MEVFIMDRYQSTPTIEIGDIVLHRSCGKGEVIEKRFVPALNQTAYQVELMHSFKKYAWLYGSELTKLD